MLYVLSGCGGLEIAGRPFELDPGCGVHIRRGESMRLSCETEQSLRLLMVVCPSPEIAPWETQVEGNAAFQAAHPVRVVRADDSQREATGDRSFRILVGPKIGSKQVTQFIGSIPKSRAPEHFHHYEEVICVLSGEGYIWIGPDKTAVRPGSLIFLPRQQAHCLECTVDEGMELVGMFYPAGSPAVNYKIGEQ